MGKSKALVGMLMKFALLLGALSAAAGCGDRQESKGGGEIVVAAAANLTDAFGEVGRRFTARTGVRVTYSLGATADLAKQIEGGFDDFDVAIATPDQMGVVGRLGRILGPRGKMPNPKTGTVTFDVGKAVRDAKAGKLEYRTDRGANVHVAIGKKSFDERQLVENYAALVEEIVRAKPAAAKGRYIRQITLTSTMGPGIHVDPQRTRDLVDELEETPEEEAVPA